MADVILVLNAGSSSVKFRAFDAYRAEPELLIYGQIEGLGTAPRFSAHDHSGAQIGHQFWDESKNIGFKHQDAIAHIVNFLRDHREEHRLVAVGHRVVHGGTEFNQATLVSPQV